MSNHQFVFWSCFQEEDEGFKMSESKFIGAVNESVHSYRGIPNAFIMCWEFAFRQEKRMVTAILLFNMLMF